MANMRVVIDTFSRKLFLVGPGGYEIRLSPGSQQFDLETSQMGHLMLPCSKFGQRSGPNTESLNFVVGDYFADAAS